jgi:prephenate dehydrogenase
MTAKGEAPVLAIVGLGPLGCALGRALRGLEGGLTVAGHDPDHELNRAARESGAVDKVSWDPAAAVAGAGVVFLTEATAAALGTLETIGPVVGAGTVVVTTGPQMLPVVERAPTLLGEGVSFVAGHVVTGPAANLSGATWCLAPAPGAADSAVGLVCRLARAVGAEVFFIDPAEHDALALGVGPLGYLLRALVLRQCAASPSIRDLRRLAPPELVAMAEGGEETTSYEEMLTASPGALRTWLDGLAAGLDRLRAAAGADSAEEWRAFFAEVDDARDAWLAAGLPEGAERAAALSQLNSGEMMRGALIGHRRRGGPARSGG